MLGLATQPTCFQAAFGLRGLLPAGSLKR